MVGEFTQGTDVGKPAETIETPDEKFETDVKDCFSDAVYNHGADKFPVFDVPEKDFFQNMSWGRKRMRFEVGSPVQIYTKSTRYNRPFYVRFKDESGKEYTRKIK